MEEQGRPIIEEDVPLDASDLHEDTQLAFLIYGRLGNRIYESVGFIGKDMTILPMLVQYYEITDIEFLIDLINTIDDHNIQKSQKSIKESIDKIKKK